MEAQLHNSIWNIRCVRSPPSVIFDRNRKRRFRKSEKMQRGFNQCKILMKFSLFRDNIENCHIVTTIAYREVELRDEWYRTFRMCFVLE